MRKTQDELKQHRMASSLRPADDIANNTLRFILRTLSERTSRVWYPRKRDEVRIQNTMYYQHTNFAIGKGVAIKDTTGDSYKIFEVIDGVLHKTIRIYDNISCPTEEELLSHLIRDL